VGQTLSAATRNAVEFGLKHKVAVGVGVGIGAVAILTGGVVYVWGWQAVLLALRSFAGSIPAIPGIPGISGTGIGIDIGRALAALHALPKPLVYSIGGAVAVGAVGVVGVVGVGVGVLATRRYYAQWRMRVHRRLRQLTLRDEVQDR
jgi:hypothetical protein